MYRILKRCFICLPLFFSGQLFAGTPVDAQLVDRWGQGTIQNVFHAGHRYYMGDPGREYAIRLHNRGPQRVLAVVSVDGINVLSGQTASAQQRGYVIAPYSSVLIDGWRKNLSEVASFNFAAVQNSYAARTGRPEHVGVIGVAVFRERVRPNCCWPEPKVLGRAPGETEEESFSAARPDGARDAQRAPETNRMEKTIAPQTPRLGTGHGQRRHSTAIEVKFERASTRPDQQLRLYYDTRQNLMARGIVRPTTWPNLRPFPQDGFVPDP